MNRTLTRSLQLFTLTTALVPFTAFAKPIIGTVTPTTATTGVPVTLQASVSSAVAIQKCTLWVDLAEVGEMTVAGGVASRSYTFASGGSRIAFVFCKDINNDAAAGANTGINVSGSIIPTPLPTPTPTPTPTPSPTPTTTIPVAPVDYTKKLIKLACPTTGEIDVNHPCKAVYFVGSDGKRHAFPNSDVFFTWYQNFDSVVTVAPEVMSSFMLGKNITYRPGFKMVKFITTPKVYVVANNGILRGITSETMAQSLYGTDWNKKIADISDAFYTNYTFGEDVMTAADFDPTKELQNSTL